MDQIGAIFKEARENQGKSIDDAAKETKIAKKYLIAIENENFNIFPGETYLIGFIRNYAQFLDLNPEEMIQRYKSYKIQEQPTPIEQLTARPKKSKYFILLSSIIFIVIISILFYIKSNKKNEVISKEIKPNKEKKISSKLKENIVMEESELIKDFRAGDVIKIPFMGKSYILTIDKIENGLDFTVGEIPFTMEKDEVVEIDFNKDGKKDIFMKINNIQEGKVNLTLKRIYKTTTNIGQLPSSTKEEKVTTSTTHPVVIIYKESELKKIPVAPNGGFIILSRYKKTNINIEITANKTAYLGFIKDDKNKKEKMLQIGDSVNINAEDQVILMLANTGGLTVKVNNISLNNKLNNTAITVKLIKWYRDRENNKMFDLVIHDLQNPNNKINYGE